MTATTDRWQTPSPFEGREAAFEQLLDRLMEGFEIDNRVTLKSYIEVAARIYNLRPDKVALPREDQRVARKDDLKQLRTGALKMASALRWNAIAIENIITDFNQQHVRGFEPEFCKSIYDQGEVDAFMTRIWQASDTLMEVARVLSQYEARGRPPDAGLRGAVRLLQNYWEHELGRKVKAEPWKPAMFAKFLEAVFEFIDRAAVGRLPSARKRARALDKNSG
jgi:hypothetical protein